MNICKFCQKTFRDKYSLAKHQKQAKYCLKIQKELEKQTRHCEHCNQELVSQEDQDYHHCYKKIVYLQSQVEKFKDQIKMIEEQLTLYKSENEQLKTQYREDLMNLASRPTVSNRYNDNRVNAIINNFEPITSQYLEDQAQFLTIEHIKQGPEGYAQFMLDYPLKDRIICVDFARRKIKYKDNDGEIVCDPEMTLLLKNIFGAIESRNSELVDSCMNELRHKLSLLGNDSNELTEDETLALNMQTDAIIDTITSITDYKMHVRHMARGMKPTMYSEIAKKVCSATSNLSQDRLRLLDN